MKRRSGYLSGRSFNTLLVYQRVQPCLLLFVWEEVTKIILYTLPYPCDLECIELYIVLPKIATSWGNRVVVIKPYSDKRALEQEIVSSKSQEG